MPHVRDALVQFALGAVAVGDRHHSIPAPTLQLPSAVGSLKAEGIFLPHRVAEQRVQFDDGAVKILDGDSGAHGCIVPCGVWLSRDGISRFPVPASRSAPPLRPVPGPRAPPAFQRPCEPRPRCRLGRT